MGSLDGFIGNNRIPGINTLFIYLNKSYSYYIYFYLESKHYLESKYYFYTYKVYIYFLYSISVMLILFFSASQDFPRTVQSSHRADLTDLVFAKRHHLGYQMLDVRKLV